jgi:hypothetical protein
MAIRDVDASIALTCGYSVPPSKLDSSPTLLYLFQLTEPQITYKTYSGPPACPKSFQYTIKYQHFFVFYIAYMYKINGSHQTDPKADRFD